MEVQHICVARLQEIVWLKGTTSGGFVLKMQSKMIAFAYILCPIGGLRDNDRDAE